MDKSITPVNIEDTMRSAYLEYAMSVIIGRALPDVRDGLKPVHRRILFAMSNLNVAHNRPYMKSARIVGEVIGKYHPHGDSAVYDATVRMVQSFSMRHPLIDGQGNFGSVDGDSPAAMRYTEVRLDKITQGLLADIDKNTVDFTANYDGSLTEPVVLPTKIPNLLINGSTGIAVGMATNIPPHNLSEVVEGLLYMIDQQNDFDVHQLLEKVSGPDFPTGGIILGRKGIYDAYMTGRGALKLRAKTHIEQIKWTQDREAIIVSELPYMVNKAKLIEKISVLVRERKLEGISDIRDESDRSGMRIVVELRRNEYPETVLVNLYKQTSMQTTFGVIMLAVVDGQPKVLPLFQVLKYFIDHRIEVIVRRTRFELNKAENRAHILDGLKIAVENIDEVVKLVRASSNALEAKQRLIDQYSLSDKQTQAILDMRLQRLTCLERDKLISELAEVLEKTGYYKGILDSEQLVLNLIKEELHEIKTLYGSDRKTEIVEFSGDISEEDLLTEESMVVTISEEGYIKRCSIDLYQSQNRGGKGKIAVTTKAEDVIKQMFTSSTHDTLLMFSNLGKVYWKRVFELPQAGRASKGRAVVNLLPLEENETIISCLPVTEYTETNFVLMSTRKGVVKKTELLAYSNKRSNGTKAILIDDDDTLVSARLCTKGDLVFIATRHGNALKFPASQMRSQGRVTRGSRGISLKIFDGVEDSVVSMEVLSGKGTLLTVTENGFGKKSIHETYRLGKRGNKGVLNLKVTEKNGKVVGTLIVNKDDEIMLITHSGKIIRILSEQVRNTDRVTQGVKLINLNQGEKVATIAKVFLVEPKNFGNQI